MMDPYVMTYNLAKVSFRGFSMKLQILKDLIRKALPVPEWVQILESGPCLVDQIVNQGWWNSDLFQVWHKTHRILPDMSAQWLNLHFARAKIAYGSLFVLLLLHFTPSSLLADRDNSRVWLKALEPCAHLGDLETAPGSWSLSPHFGLLQPQPQGLFGA